jgi:hypothetical protein
MRDVLEVLREKELEIERVRKEIKAVRLAAVLLLIADHTSDQAKPGSRNLGWHMPQPGAAIKDRISMFKISILLMRSSIPKQ